MSDESYVLDHDVTISDGIGSVTYTAGTEVTRLDLGVYFMDHTPRAAAPPPLFEDEEP